MSLGDRFDAALERIKALPSTPAPGTLLELYGLFKQATTGDIVTERPGPLDFKGRAKWDAWASRRGLLREAAMQEYIALVDRLSPPAGESPR